MTTDLLAIRVLISGRVQGVGFRAWTERQASAAGLSGWVRNRPGGDVEAVFSGPSVAVERLLGMCREGPPGSAVSRVDVLGPAEAQGGPFTIRRDGSD